MPKLKETLAVKNIVTTGGLLALSLLSVLAGYGLALAEVGLEGASLIGVLLDFSEAFLYAGALLAFLATLSITRFVRIERAPGEPPRGLWPHLTERDFSARLTWVSGAIFAALFALIVIAVEQGALH